VHCSVLISDCHANLLGDANYRICRPLVLLYWWAGDHWYLIIFVLNIVTRFRIWGFLTCPLQPKWLGIDIIMSNCSIAIGCEHLEPFFITTFGRVFLLLEHLKYRAPDGPYIVLSWFVWQHTRLVIIVQKSEVFDMNLPAILLDCYYCSWNATGKCYICFPLSDMQLLQDHKSCKFLINK
jgi:hypothetical protein